MIFVVETIWQMKCLLGEGPIIDPVSDKLWFVDIKKSQVHSLDLTSGDKNSIQAPIPVTALAQSSQVDRFWASASNGFYSFDKTDGCLYEIVQDIEPELPNNRMNDGALAPDGSFWAGTMDDEEENQTAGSWYRLDPNGSVLQLEQGYFITNGPAFSPDGKSVYLTDSAKQKIYKASIPALGKKITHKEIWKQFGSNDGGPDGMCFDNLGRLWIAFWDGACVRAFDEDGTLLQEVKMPVSRPTKPIYDAKRNCLYVTSASVGLDAGDEPLAGSLFKVSLP